MLMFTVDTAISNRPIQPRISKHQITPIKPDFNQDDHRTRIMKVLNSPLNVFDPRLPSPRIEVWNNRVKRLVDLISCYEDGVREIDGTCYCYHAEDFSTFLSTSGRECLVTNLLQV